MVLWIFSITLTVDCLDIGNSFAPFHFNNFEHLVFYVNLLVDVITLVHL